MSDEVAMSAMLLTVAICFRTKPDQHVVIQAHPVTLRKMSEDWQQRAQESRFVYEAFSAPYSGPVHPLLLMVCWADVLYVC